MSKNELYVENDLNLISDETPDEIPAHPHQNRSRQYYRVQRKKHIQRKRHLIDSWSTGWGYNYDGQYSKGKIHCSCWLCSAKYGSDKGPGISDLRKLERIDSALEEYRRLA